MYHNFFATKGKEIKSKNLLNPCNLHAINFTLLFLQGFKGTKAKKKTNLIYVAVICLKQRCFSENLLVCHFITLKLSQNRINP